MALIALFFLFFKLPGVPEFFGISNCSSCTTFTPYLPMFAAAYFSAFLTSILCFRSWPSRSMKYAGIAWSIGLAIGLTYIGSGWCLICLVCHGCHLGMWLLWKPSQERGEEMVGMKLSLVFASFMAAMALFSTLNFTFLVYGLQVKSSHVLVKTGSKVKPFELMTTANESLSLEELPSYKGVVLNFVSANCLYCKEQIPTLDEMASDFYGKGFRFINISHQLPSDLQALGPHLEWVEDKQDQLRPHFGISGYPTLILLDPEGTVIKTTRGASSGFQEMLQNQLDFLAER
ncbi:MAG: TlpA disulfide reductase family protein [Chlamydiales bacterium]